jgi:hypothetical protein
VAAVPERIAGAQAGIQSARSAARRRARCVYERLCATGSRLGSAPIRAAWRAARRLDAAQAPHPDVRPDPLPSPIVWRRQARALRSNRSAACAAVDEGQRFAPGPAPNFGIAGERPAEHPWGAVFRAVTCDARPRTPQGPMDEVDDLGHFRRAHSLAAGANAPLDPRHIGRRATRLSNARRRHLIVRREAGSARPAAPGDQNEGEAWHRSAPWLIARYSLASAALRALSVRAAARRRRASARAACWGV